MNIKQCLYIFREIKDIAFATVDKNNCPQVRIIDIMMVDDNKLYFVTARGKHFYKQLIHNKNVSITTLTKNFEMIRLSGIAIHLSEQKKWVDKIFELNPVMNDVYPNDSRYILEPFYIEYTEIEYFDLSSKPIYHEKYFANENDITQERFFIGKECIECGKCANICPQQCIKEGTPYIINQNNCLHCGLCFENCVTKAIKENK